MSSNTVTDLRLAGMSCASCATKVERGLNALNGVHATVNFAVERAHIEHDPAVSAGDLIAAVESAGYHAAVLTPPVRPHPITLTIWITAAAPGSAPD